MNQENQENQDEYNPFEEFAQDSEQSEAAATDDKSDRQGRSARTEEGQAPGASQQADDESADTKQELARMKEAMLRLKAETDNREKRLEREMNKTRKFALEALMRDLVQVLDSMDQALSSADGAVDGSAPEGMELVRKQALQVLSSHGLEVLDPDGEKFDPSWHEAMATQPSEEHEADTIVRVLQKGYQLNDRLIRPARVIVASGRD